MDKNRLSQLLKDVRDGQCSVQEAVSQMSHLPLETDAQMCLDHHRTLRTGIPEVIYGQSKTAEQIITIARSLLKNKNVVMATKVDKDKAENIIKALPELEYHQTAQMLTGNKKKGHPKEKKGHVVIVSGGTSDIPVAEEARITAQSLGNSVDALYDVGVAGLHRLLNKQQILRDASVIIVVAGMEGALPSVIAGLVDCPVIGVPTSIGYGTGIGGIAALLSMLNSCAPGIGVVNIDNGFGAGCLAASINRKS